MKTTIKEDSQNSGFKIPENYFDELENSVMKKINTPSKSFYLGHRFWAIAASIILIAGISILVHLITLNNSTPENAQLYSSITDTNSKSEKIIPEISINPEKAEIQQSNNSEEAINNALVELADELNLSDEEFIEFSDNLEI